MITVHIEIDKEGRYVHADFNALLTEGKDAIFDRQKQYTGRYEDTILLDRLMAHLFTDDSGVDEVAVKPLETRVKHNRAVTSNSVVARLLKASRTLDNIVVEVDKDGRIIQPQPDRTD